MKYSVDNHFYKIIIGEINADKIFEDEQMLIIKDLYPAAPVHWLAIPKGKYLSFEEFCKHSTSGQISHFFSTIQAIAAKYKLNEHGYRLVTNHGENAGQTIFHFHVHILSGEKFDKLV